LLLKEAGDVGPVGSRRVILGESAKRLVRADDRASRELDFFQRA
jgi:hypothetical protein